MPKTLIFERILAFPGFRFLFFLSKKCIWTVSKIAQFYEWSGGRNELNLSPKTGDNLGRFLRLLFSPDQILFIKQVRFPPSKHSGRFEPFSTAGVRQEDGGPEQKVLRGQAR